MTEPAGAEGPEVAPSVTPKRVIAPTPGEVITSAATRNSYTMGQQIGEGVFGVVFACTDFWGNDLAVKVLKPRGSYEQVKAAATAEITKLLRLRHPYITYVFDAFEFRDTFHIVTERCYGPLTDLYRLPNFNGLAWLLPIARCLLQAVHFLHVNLFVHQDIHLGNVFAAFARDEMLPQNPGAIHFKLADLGVAKFFNEVDVHNTRAEWMLPPEVLNSTDLGPIDRRVDLYHVGLLLLQLATSQQLVFTREEVLAGRPRELALTLPPPYNTALEKSLRRHVPARTASAMELWRDLKTGEVAGAPAIAAVSS